jgi:hypothetical protein
VLIGVERLSQTSEEKIEQIIEMKKAKTYLTVGVRVKKLDYILDLQQRSDTSLTLRIMRFSSSACQ